MAQTVRHLPTMQETRVQSLGQEDLLEQEMATHSIGKFFGRRRLVGYNPWGLKESDMTEQLQCQCQCTFENTLEVENVII